MLGGGRLTSCQYREFLLAMHPEAEAPVPATTPSAPNLATARRSKQRFGVLSSATLIRTF